MKTLITYNLLTLVIALSSCEYLKLKKDQQEKIATAIARVGDKYLYHEDIEQVIPSNLPAEDSISLTNEFIESWIKHELLYSIAEEEDEIDHKMINKQINDLKFSLVAHELEKVYVKKKLDTIVSNDEVVSYYNDKKASFILRNNIVQSIFVKVNKNMAKYGKLQRLIKSMDSNNKADLIAFLDDDKNQVEAYQINDVDWIDFSDLLIKIPIKVENQQAFLKTTKYFSKTEGDFRYNVMILDYKLKNETPPISYVEDQIKNLIIHKRKARLTKKFKEDIFKDAKSNNEFEIF